MKLPMDSIRIRVKVKARIHSQHESVDRTAPIDGRDAGAAADDDDAGLSKAQGWRRSSSTPRDDDA